MKVYLEIGKRRTFACAVDWVGWARAGKTDQAALQALVEYGPRYAAAMGKLAADLKLPASVDVLDVVDRHPGDATTDFGAPGAIPDEDRRQISAPELDRLVQMLEVSWQAFEVAAKAAHWKKLAPAGPRGGGRALDKIRAHVTGAEGGYTNAVGGRVQGSKGADSAIVRRAFIDAIRARARGEVPDRGPRGGVRWPAPYAVRRSAWHALDHAWEIEDRANS